LIQESQETLKYIEFKRKKYPKAGESVVFTIKKHSDRICSGFVFEHISGQVVFIDQFIGGGISLAFVEYFQPATVVDPGNSICTHLEVVWGEILNSSDLSVVKHIEHPVVRIYHHISFDNKEIRSVRQEPLCSSIVKHPEIAKIVDISHNTITNFEGIGSIFFHHRGIAFVKKMKMFVVIIHISNQISSGLIFDWRNVAYRVYLSPVKNAEKIIKEIKNNPGIYDVVEVMACPGGCVGGGGQPIPTTSEIVKKRADSLYSIDNAGTTKRAHENPIVKKIYEEFFNNMEIRKELLHTEFSKREKSKIDVINDSKETV